MLHSTEPIFITLFTGNAMLTTSFQLVKLGKKHTRVPASILYCTTPRPHRNKFDSNEVADQKLTIQLLPETFAGQIM